MSQDRPDREHDQDSAGTEHPGAGSAATSSGPDDAAPRAGDGPAGAPPQTSVDSPAESPAGTTDSAEPGGDSARPGGASAEPGGGAVAPGTAAPSTAAAPDIATPGSAPGSLAASESVTTVGSETAAPPLTLTAERQGMFGVRGSGDTSGYGLLHRAAVQPKPAERPYGGYFDEVADALAAAMTARSIDASTLELTTVANGEITFYLRPENLQAVLWAVRDEPALRFEMLSSLSGVDYGPQHGDPDPEPVPRSLHVVYELLSMTYRRRIRLEVAVAESEPYVPSAVPVYPTADWHERETYDMFGIVFTGHPALTRILMPDDWEGYPQRKSYPLGGIPVEYKGAEIPPPDERRVYS